MSDRVDLEPVRSGHLDAELLHPFVGREADDAESPSGLEPQEHALEDLEDLLERVLCVIELALIVVAQRIADCAARLAELVAHRGGVVRERLHVHLVEPVLPRRELVDEALEPLAVALGVDAPRVGVELGLDEHRDVVDERLVVLQDLAERCRGQRRRTGRLLPLLAHLRDALERALDAHDAAVPIGATADVEDRVHPADLPLREGEVTLWRFAERAEHREVRGEGPRELSVAPFAEVAGEVLGELVRHSVEHLDFRALHRMNEEERPKRSERTFPEVLDFEEGDAILRDLLHPHDVAGDENTAPVVGLDHGHLSSADELEGDGFGAEDERSGVALVRIRERETCQGEPAGVNH